MPEKTLKEKVGFDEWWAEFGQYVDPESENIHSFGVEKSFARAGYQAGRRDEARVEELEEELTAGIKLRRIFDMAKYEIRDVHKAIDGLLDERMTVAAAAATLLGEVTDDSGRTVQIQLHLEARPEMFLPMEAPDVE